MNNWWQKCSFLPNDQKTRSEILLLIGFFLIFILLILRALVLNSPIMGGDEYAYFIHGKYYFNNQLLQNYDPMLQGMNNRLYFLIEQIWFTIGNNNAALIGKIWNALLYCLGGLLLFSLLKRVFNTIAAASTVAVYLLLPMSMYTVTLLPEVDFQVMFYLLVYAFVVLWPSYPIKTAVITGIIVAIAFFIKPHAIAFFLAIILAMILSPLLRYSRRVRWRESLIAISIFCLICYTGIIVLGRLLVGSWEFNPSVLVGQLYSGYLQKGTSIIFLIKNFIIYIKYVLVHLTVFALIFPMGLAVVILDFWKSTRLSRREDTPLTKQQITLVLLLCAATVAFIVMISVFTASAGLQNQSEQNRIHGRYLIFLLPFFISYMFTIGPSINVRFGRITACLGLLSVFVFFVLIMPRFKIFPWDYPELFAFYTFPNNYWDWTKGLSLGGYLLSSLGVISGLIALMRPLWAKRIYIVYLFVVILAGQYQTNAWVFSQSKSVGPLTEAAQSVHQLLGAVKEGNGAIVGDDRYGTLSYILMGFDSAQHVVVRDIHAGINSNDITKGLGWILAPEDYPVKVPYIHLMRIGPLSLYQLQQGYPFIINGEEQKWNGEALRVELNQGDNTGITEGFNLPEPWGSWTSQNQASVNLPVTINGDGILRFSGWTVNQNFNTPLKIQLGKETLEVKLSGKNEIHEVKFHLTEAVNRIQLEMPAYRDHPGDRALGVALQFIEISRPNNTN